MGQDASETKVKRNLAIAKMREDNPDMSMADIGQAFDISRQRVLQILKRWVNGDQSG